LDRALFIKVLFLVTVCVMLLNCGTGGPANTLEKIRQEKYIAIAIHPVNPPFEYGAGTGVKGFDADLAELIAKEMQVEAKWIKKPFDKCFEYLRKGDVDMVINAVTITENRQEEFLFSDPYFETGQIIAVKEDVDNIETTEDLMGKKVGVQRNTTADLYLRREGKNEINIQPYDSFEDALFDLNRDLLDAVVGDAPTILYNIRELFPSIKTVGDLLTDEKYGIVFRTTDTELCNEVNRILAKLKQDGTLDDLVKKWNLVPAMEEDLAQMPDTTE